MVMKELEVKHACAAWTGATWLRGNDLLVENPAMNNVEMFVHMIDGMGGMEIFNTFLLLSCFAFSFCNSLLSYFRNLKRVTNKQTNEQIEYFI